MKQRVVMVLSTLLDPSLLIADELTSALDVSTQKAVAEMLVEFRDRKFVKSTIVITHDLSILYQIADTILVMYAGKLVEKASATEITEDPRHPYTQLLSRIAARGRCSLRGEAAEWHPRPPALAPQPADRMPLPRALSAGVREMRRGATVRGDRAGAPHRLLEGGCLMLELDGVTKVFKTGMFGKSEITARLRRQLRSPSGRGGLPDRRERQRQDDRRPNDPAADRSDGRDDHVRRSERVPVRSGRPPALLRPCPGGLPGSLQLVQPGLQGRPRARHDPVELPPGVECRRLEGATAQIARGRLARAFRCARQVPAPAERWAASTSDDRPRARPRHQVPGRRRDHQHARCLDPDRRPQPARGSEGAGRRNPLHHPRPLARQLHLGQDPDPTPRQDRRVRGDPQGVRQSATPLHSGTSRVGAATPPQVGEPARCRPRLSAPLVATGKASADGLFEIEADHFVAIDTGGDPE